MHYYQFNIGDYKSHTEHLDLLEDLAFRRMIDWCYLHESPLPLDINTIAKRILMRTHTESIANVLEEFFTKTEEGYFNKRIMLEVDTFKAKSDSARKAAEARWAKVRAQSEGNANALQTQSEGNAKQETRNKKHKPLNKKQETNDLPSAKADDRVLEVFNNWLLVMGKTNQSKLTKERKKKITDRLNDGYTVDQIKAAIYGCSVTPHNMGQNDNNKRYDDIELICRTGTNLERFANNSQSQAPRQFSAKTERTISALQNVELT